jgi:tetratricopeptide (TPR) repeat protein
MANIQLQRTLLIGLGEAGARTTDCLLTEVARWLGELGVIQGVAVAVEEVTLENVETPLFISPEAIFETWQHDFDMRVELALRQISQLSNLPQLARQGLGLRRPDEVHLIVIVDLAEAWTRPIIAPLLDTLRQMIERTLACQVGVSGVLLNFKSIEPESLEANQAAVVAYPINRFDRGCFLAGLANEVGLIIGNAERLIQATVNFLALLLIETPATGLDWEDHSPLGWGSTLTSFGIATLRWPGSELVKILSARWSQALLEQMLTLSQSSHRKIDLAQQARESVQQWLTSQKLSPPLLLERLAAPMPLLPNHLSALIPDPPWPWLLVRTQANLESMSQRWQDEWLAMSKERFNPALAELQAKWPRQTEAWLTQQLAAQSRQGTVLIAQSYLAEVSEMLQAFIEGVEQKLEEAEADLASLDQQLGQAAEALDQALVAFPASPVSALFHWGGRPLRWPYYWARCWQAQTLARNFAHLSRGRLIVWQMVSYYEELLPFYRQLLADWRSLVERWMQTCQQVVEASTAADLANWPDQLERCLQTTGGPWSEAFVTTLYQEVLARHPHTIWEQLGSLSDWMVEAIEAKTITSRLIEQTAHHLTSVAAIPVDQALNRQLPDEKVQANWLTSMLEQARPFWRYDETTLAEHSRAQVRLETWLLLPDGETSLLAPLIKNLSQPTRLLASRQSEEMAVVTVRRIQWEGPEAE